MGGGGAQHRVSEVGSPETLLGTLPTFCRGPAPALDHERSEGPPSVPQNTSAATTLALVQGLLNQLGNRVEVLEVYATTHLRCCHRFSVCSWRMYA